MMSPQNVATVEKTSKTMYFDSLINIWVGVLGVTQKFMYACFDRFSKKTPYDKINSFLTC
mgnify:CR=1 FL=1